MFRYYGYEIRRPLSRLPAGDRVCLSKVLLNLTDGDYLSIFSLYIYKLKIKCC